MPRNSRARRSSRSPKAPPTSRNSARSMERRRRASETHLPRSRTSSPLPRRGSHDQVSDVRASDRLTKVPSVSSRPNRATTASSRKYCRALAVCSPAAKPILEINPDHPVVKAVAAKNDRSVPARGCGIAAARPGTGSGRRQADRSSRLCRAVGAAVGKSIAAVKPLGRLNRRPRRNFPDLLRFNLAGGKLR